MGNHPLEPAVQSRLNRGDSDVDDASGNIVPTERQTAFDDESIELTVATDRLRGDCGAVQRTANPPGRAARREDDDLGRSTAEIRTGDAAVNSGAPSGGPKEEAL